MMTTEQRADYHRRLAAADLTPCGDHGCIFGHPGGMGTNGGCQHIEERDPILLRRMLAGVAAVAQSYAQERTAKP